MGLMFVLLFWAVAGLILSGIGSAVFVGTATFLTRGIKHSRKKLLITAGVFPFLCLGWAGAVFVFQALINVYFLHRDPGLGDGWECPLPNGYAIMMIDVTDQGTVYNPKTQLNPDSVSDQWDTVPGVRRMQVSGRYLLLEADSKYFGNYNHDDRNIDSYFLLDTRNGKPTPFSSEQELFSTATQLGIHTDLQPIAKVYGKYRFTWFDWFTLGLLLVPPLLFFGYLIRWILRLRRFHPLIMAENFS